MANKIKIIRPKLTAFQSKALKRVLDFIIIFISFGAATVLERSTIHVDFMPLLGEMAVFSVIAVSLFYILRVYRAIWGYISLFDLFHLAAASVFVIALYFGVREAVYDKIGLPHIFFSQPIVTGYVMLSALVGVRIFYRIMHFGRFGGLSWKHKDRVRVLIIGAGDQAEIFIRTIINNPHSAYHIVGILDPSDIRQKRTIHSIPVLGRPDQLRRVFAKLRKLKKSPQRIIFTTTSDTKHVPIDVLIEEADRLGLSFSRLPSLTEFRDNESIIPQLKPIAIEDLIGRPQAKLDTKSIEELVKGNRVLITGAGGSIGSELSQQVASFAPSSMLIIDNCEYNLYAIDWDLRNKHPQLDIETRLSDIRNREKINQIFQDYKPDIIFHAAALKHVPLVEMNPSEGILTNVIGTNNVADAALKVKARAFVQISTDKAVNPTNIMGASKRIGEFYAQALDLNQTTTRFITVRFGNVLGSSGSVVPLFKKQLEMGGPITVTHPEIKRYFMTIKEAVGLVLQASAAAITQNKGERGYIFVLDMGEALKIIDVARQMIRLADLVPDEDIQIKIVGLRPGEKLYEELFDAGENRLKTSIPSTFAANPTPHKMTKMKKSIAALQEAADNNDIEAIKDIIGDLVPGFNHTA